EGFFKPGEDERIIQYLSARQTSEAAETPIAGSAGLTRDDRPLSQTPAPAKPGSAASSLPTIGVTILTAAVFGTLLWRRPKSPSPGIPPAKAQTALASTMKKPVILQLIRKERQTHDCFSLRFRVAGTAALEARPGQFLTFDWLLDGQKLARSYS